MGGFSGTFCVERDVFLPGTEWPVFPEKRVQRGFCLGPRLRYS